MKFLPVLILNAVVLLVGCGNGSPAEKKAEVIPQIESVVQRLLTQYQIDSRSIKKRSISSGDKEFSRVELRVSVAPEFNGLNFNRDLSSAVQDFGAIVIATEKSGDKSVAMHIKKEGVILMSLVFKPKE